MTRIQQTCSVLLIVVSTVAFVHGGVAQQVGAANTGTLVVVNKQANAVNLIDLTSDRIVSTLRTGNGPHEVVVSEDGLTAVVTDYGGGGAGGNTLTVIDIRNARVARTVDLGRYTRPHGIQYLPGDSLVAVTSESTQHVVVVRPADGETVHALPTGHPGSHMVAATGTGNFLFTGNMGDATVSQISPASGDVARTFTVPAQPEAITVTLDGSEVWVGSNAEGTVNVVNTQTGQVQRALEGFGWPYRILITPDQAQVLIPDLRNNQLRFIDRATRRQLHVLDIPGGPQGIALSRDHRSAFLSLSQRNEVAVIDLATRRIVRRIATGNGPDGVAHTLVRPIPGPS